MKTIFAKYNSERLPKYQIVTKIVVDNNDQKYAIKEALCDEAKSHIEDIYNNYELLKTTHNLNLVKPIKTENGVMFEMAQGISLETILLEAITQNDKKKFTKYVDKFLSFLDGMVSKKDIVFEPCEKFTAMFGEWESNEPQDIIRVANIDLIFGNIFVDENDEFTLIDYEWVFDFEVPKSYIAWRSLAIFSAYHSIDLSKYMDNFNEIENQRFLKYDDMFSNFVHGKNKEYFLAPKVGKRVDFINFEKKETILNYDYFIQLFISNENGFSEENSIKYPVLQTTELQNFEFDLKDFGNIKNLRLDPLNDSCVVNISQIYLVLEDDLQIDLKANIQANVCAHHGDSYFFEFFDPQIYFENVDLESLSIKKFVIELIYNHIAKDAVHTCANQIAMDKNYIIKNQNQTIENQNKTIENQNQTIENQNQTIENQNQTIENQNQTIENLNQTIENLNQTIENLNQTIENQNQTIENQNQTIENQNQTIENQNQTIENINDELISIYMSKSWKITRPLRSLIRKIKKGK